jgi:hypothetical protein
MRSALLAAKIPPHHVDELIASRWPMTLDMLLCECRHRGKEVTREDVVEWHWEEWPDWYPEGGPPESMAFGPADVDELLAFLSR